MNSSREYIHHSTNVSALSARISKMTSKFANVTQNVKDVGIHFAYVMYYNTKH